MVSFVCWAPAVLGYLEPVESSGWVFSLTLAIGALFFNIDDIEGYGNDTEAEKVG